MNRWGSGWLLTLGEILVGIVQITEERPGQFFVECSYCGAWLPELVDKQTAEELRRNHKHQQGSRP